MRTREGPGQEGEGEEGPDQEGPDQEGPDQEGPDQEGEDAEGGRTVRTARAARTARRARTRRVRTARARTRRARTRTVRTPRRVRTARRVRTPRRARTARTVRTTRTARTARTARTTARRARTRRGRARRARTGGRGRRGRGRGRARATRARTGEGEDGEDQEGEDGEDEGEDRRGGREEDAEGGGGRGGPDRRGRARRATGRGRGRRGRGRGGPGPRGRRRRGSDDEQATPTRATTRPAKTRARRARRPTTTRPQAGTRPLNMTVAAAGGDPTVEHEASRQPVAIRLSSTTGSPMLSKGRCRSGRGARQPTGAGHGWLRGRPPEGGLPQEGGDRFRFTPLRYRRRSRKGEPSDHVAGARDGIAETNVERPYVAQYPPAEGVLGSPPVTEQDSRELASDPSPGRGQLRRRDPAHPHRFADRGDLLPRCRAGDQVQRTVLGHRRKADQSDALQTDMAIKPEWNGLSHVEGMELDPSFVQQDGLIRAWIGTARAQQLAPEAGKSGDRYQPGGGLQIYIPKSETHKISTNPSNITRLDEALVGGQPMSIEEIPRLLSSGQELVRSGEAVPRRAGRSRWLDRAGDRPLAGGSRQPADLGPGRGRATNRDGADGPTADHAGCR